MKKLLVAGMALLLFFVAGCGQKKQPQPNPVETEPVVSQSEPEKTKNPLTGVSEFTNGEENNRPVAIMINNIKIAQPVQTGLSKADIIYETEVEGGITRLMAVFQNVAEAGQIGTVRSARYAYVDLAMGHNAIYIHCGEDPIYCKPHLKDVENISLSENNYGKRLSNGLSSEHTLYTFGSTLWEGLKEDKVKTTNKNTNAWQHFASEEDTLQLSGGTANSVTVAFSTSYTTGFTYDPSVKLYTRLFGGRILNDYKTGTATQVKNVFILMTNITDYPDGKHRKVALQGGDGYYVTGGAYTPIKWTKGAASNAFSFQNSDGTPLTVSAGNSWVCIANKYSSQPKFQ